jgi:hypothetical protein
MKQTRWYSPRISANLQKVYDRASAWDFQEGMHWYANANTIARGMAERHKISTMAACGIIAALSPGSQWDRNVEDAKLFLDEWTNGARGNDLPLVGSYGWRNVNKAARCAGGDNPWDVLGGNKVRAFYACMVDPTNDKWVCIDRHAKGAAWGYPLPETEAIVTPGQYAKIAKHYIRAAKKTKILPHQFQAVVWVAWRRLGGQLEQEDLPF